MNSANIIIGTCAVDKLTHILLPLVAAGESFLHFFTSIGKTFDG